MHIYRVVPQTKRVNRYTCFDRSIKAGIFWLPSAPLSDNSWSVLLVIIHLSL